MNQFVQLQQPIYSADGCGGFEEEWREIGKAWAKIIPMSQFKNTDVYRKKVSVCIVMRYDSNIRTDMRIIADTSGYDIINITNIENRFIIIAAMEVHHLCSI